MAHESQRITSVHKYLPKTMEVWKIADRFHRGIADAYYGGTETDLWVEWKSQTMNKITPTRPKLSSLQNAWLKKQYDLGRNVWVIMLTDQQHHIMNSPSQWERGIPPWTEGYKKYPDVAQAIIDFCQKTGDA